MEDLNDMIDSPFYSPFDNVIIKGKEEDGKWIVYLEASNELKDQDGEIVDMKALEKAKEYYLSHGVISWDHKHKQTNDPKYIIGEPLDIKFTADNRTVVKAMLYQHNKIAQGLWDNIKSGAKKLGSSIGGGILHKAKERLTSIIWDEIAITHKPVNDGTLGSVQVVPFAQFAKALMAGSGVDAGTFTGGRALIPESLQGNEGMPGEPALVDMFNKLMVKVISGDIRDYNDMVAYVLDKGYPTDVARRIIYHIAQNMPVKA